MESALSGPKRHVRLAPVQGRQRRCRLELAGSMSLLSKMHAKHPQKHVSPQKQAAKAGDCLCRVVTDTHWRYSCLPISMRKSKARQSETHQFCYPSTLSGQALWTFWL